MKTIKLGFFQATTTKLENKDFVFIDSAINPELDKIKEYFIKQGHVIDDVVLFAKEPMSLETGSSYGILCLYYFKFYKGSVVFFTLDDYLEYRDYSLSKDIYLYVESESQLSENTDRNMIKGAQILVLNQESQTIEPIKITTQI